MQDKKVAQVTSKATKPAPTKYFEAAKKNEVNEIKQLLKNSLNFKDDTKRRDIIKKVIAYMTLGIDISGLFNEMCLVSYTNDIISKKMIYFYISTYAEQNPDSAIMAINTFLKDCKHKDPKIRGLALRNLCSLRFMGSLEYLIPAIQTALKDFDPYVRKAAILGCVKVYYMKPEMILVENKDIIDTLYKLIRDQDPMVITNAIEALKEILANEGGIAKSAKMVIYLLNRIKDFNEWGQTTVLQLISTYKPKSDEEMLDIMNILDDRLKSSCVSIVLSIIKIFLNITEENPTMKQQVFKRVKTPLITLMSSSEIQGTFEITYVVLSHILFIVQIGGSDEFQADFKQFYAKADDPSYIKFLKLDIISYLACETNIGDLINELGEYVVDIDMLLAKKSIETLGKIALRVKEMATPIAKQLSTFISIQKEYITNQTVVEFKNILRKFPEQFKEIGETISQSADFCTESDAKCALIWIMGEFAELVPDAPYLLENFLNQEQTDQSVEVQSSLLECSIKMFLKRPAETHQVLAAVFLSVFKDEQIDIDLKDRAAFYYRALFNDIEEFKKLYQQMSTEKPDTYIENEEEKQLQYTLQFNSFSVIFKKSAEKFIKPLEYFTVQRNKELQAELKRIQDMKKSDEEMMEEKAESAKQNLSSSDVPPEKENAVEEINLLDIDLPSQPQEKELAVEHKAQATTQPAQSQDQGNLLDLDFNVGQQQQPSSLEPKPQAGPSLSLSLNDFADYYSIDPDYFAQMWEQLTYLVYTEKKMRSNAKLNTNQIEELFKSNRVYSIATGEQDYVIRIYLYSKHKVSENELFVEFEMNTSASAISWTVKSKSKQFLDSFSKYVENFLLKNNIVTV